MARTTIKDIARECGVSLSTVSLVLNNNPRISEETRAKVLAVVEKHGYQPDINARGLASRSSSTISVVVPHLNHVFADVYFGEIVSGIYDRATEKNYKVMLDVANTRFVETREYLKLLKSRRADGMLFIASAIQDEYLRAFEDNAHAFLLVNHYFPGSSLNYIAVDYKDSACLAADHLVGLGHKAIGFIAGTNTYTGLRLRDSFLERCKEHGLKTKDLPWVECGKDWSQEEGYEAARQLMAKHAGLTAIMGANDRLAMGAMRYLHTHDLRTPQDISVMGVDDIPASAFTTPGLTTIRHDLYQLGTLACDRLLSLFKSEITECRDILPVKMIVRETTGPRTSRR
ncbi:MAG: LacI family DNA-binding transcriptional regulator [Lentisphaerota bacterium]